MIKLINAFQLSIVRKKYLLCKSFRLGFGQNICCICYIFDLACCETSKANGRAWLHRPARDSPEPVIARCHERGLAAAGQFGPATGSSH
jgi:hypothetical protein